MPLLFDLMRLATLMRIAAHVIPRLIHFAIFNAYFPRVPPPNWNNMTKSMIRVGSEPRTGGDGFQRPMKEIGKYVDLSNPLDLAPVERIFLDDFPAILEIPIPTSKDTISIKVEKAEIEDESMTVVETSPSTEIYFSIYADVSSPNLNKAMFITPPRSSLVSAQELQFSLLKAASERVSEILRENRRRLDTGEDSNIIRREARRRRAQELSAARNKAGRPT